MQKPPPALPPRVDGQVKRGRRGVGPDAGSPQIKRLAPRRPVGILGFARAGIGCVHPDVVPPDPNLIPAVQIHGVLPLRTFPRRQFTPAEAGAGRRPGMVSRPWRQDGAASPPKTWRLGNCRLGLGPDAGDPAPPNLPCTNHSS